jgi:hypothetical protein
LPSVFSGYLLGLRFEPEDGGSMFLQNIQELLSDYMALHPKRGMFKEIQIPLYISYLLGLRFEPEDGGSMFLQNI